MFVFGVEAEPSISLTNKFEYWKIQREVWTESPTLSLAIFSNISPVRTYCQAFSSGKHELWKIKFQGGPQARDYTKCQVSSKFWNGPSKFSGNFPGNLTDARFTGKFGKRALDLYSKFQRKIRGGDILILIFEARLKHGLLRYIGLEDERFDAARYFIISFLSHHDIFFWFLEFNSVMSSLTAISWDFPSFYTILKSRISNFSKFYIKEYETFIGIASEHSCLRLCLA